MCNAVLIIEIKSAAYATDDVLRVLAHLPRSRSAKADRKTLKGEITASFGDLEKKKKTKGNLLRRRFLPKVVQSIIFIGFNVSIDGGRIESRVGPIAFV